MPLEYLLTHSHTISLDLNNLDFATAKNALVYSFPLEKFVKEENSKENSHI